MVVSPAGVELYTFTDIRAAQTEVAALNAAARTKRSEPVGYYEPVGHYSSGAY